MRRLFFFFGCILASALTVSYAASTDQSKQDQRFVTEAAQGGQTEVELGQLAEKNGSSPEVKQFGQQMVTDHTRLNQDLGKTAQDIGLQVPTDVSKKQRAEIDSLSKLTGKEFDAKYTSLMVKDHTEDLAAFQKEEASTQNADLKKAIGAAIPVIEHHLQMAKSNESKMAAAQ